ncbi:DUF4381 domain-containing protein [Candidatus Methylospira mobilis]|uniref:DUF4381 domain-containing protein n=1 Tax=Candidatus Methylospira mobilis TaxID=1808979 RepID=A0A5Q0BKH6_9GAMM|nr:DUF4381 domain-containing protein [Candidatus Methylospira mobilis]QFY44079.1 DUF4381 domain-containing protein [Candidatus Methylospira mobilis]WNV06519.1 DUF4381 domain-containing protein [Candidatus Methylospira mobilis]
MPQDDLPLRDIHLPPPPGFWPPAPGWWIVLALILVMALLSFWLWRRRRRLVPRKAALKSLDVLQGSDLTQKQQLQELAILMRRACLTAYPRATVAGLTGVAWLDFMDKQYGSTHFNTAIGRLLVEAAYRPDEPGELDALFALCRVWLQKMPAPVKKRV